MNPLSGNVKLYGALGVLAVILALALALVFQTQRLHVVQAEYDRFVAQAKAEGERAAAQAVVKAAADKQRKDEADAQVSSALARLAADNARLSRERASRGYLPAASAGSRSPETACFGRAELEQALRQLDAGVSGLIEEGTETAVKLNGAKRWAQQKPMKSSTSSPPASK